MLIFLEPHCNHPLAAVSITRVTSLHSPIGQVLLFSTLQEEKEIAYTLNDF